MLRKKGGGNSLLFIFKYAFVFPGSIPGPVFASGGRSIQIFIISKSTASVTDS